MSNKAKKLSLRKESLRNLSAEDMSQVAGGTYLAYNADWCMLRVPQPATGGCTTNLFYFNFNRYYF